VKLSFNEERLDSAFLPASTFKIINSMIALETEVIKDENEIIKWDSIDRGNDNWNRDQNLESGLKYSAVWFYQELARRIGEERMKYWVEASDYGNKNINGGIDVFWLRGDIRISSNQQIDFLKKLYFNQLPFSQKNQEIVKRIMIVDQTADYTIRAKTGWAARIDNQIGWYVGYLEKGENVYFFTVNIDIKNSDDAAKRKIIVSKILDHLQLTK
jgi:beta-lactamase class D